VNLEYLFYLNVYFSGERRIRVHTLCLPVAASLSDILYSADQQCIVGLLAKMGKLLFFIGYLLFIISMRCTVFIFIHLFEIVRKLVNL
jgi:hypothetical protein